MENFDIDGTPFSVLMDRAVTLKQQQTKHQRERYDLSPSFLSNSIFPNEDTMKARGLDSFNDRLGAAIRIKDEGNSAFRDGGLGDALSKYEMALSVFRYIENTNPKWKSEGIKDEYIEENRYQCKTEEEQHTLDQFLVICYNNIALVSYKMASYTLAIRACDYAIEVDDTNDKSFYLRAKARIAPKSSGATELRFARSDLQIALRNSPNNKEAKKLLQEINTQTKAQRSRDKNIFSGMFDRGEVYNAQELTKDKESRKKSAEQDGIDSKQKDIILGRQLVKHYEERGMEKEKQKLEQSLNNEIRMMDKNANLNNLDFRNPTLKMVKDAAKCGVDLNDPQTIELLEDMQDKHNIADASESGHMKPTTNNFDTRGSSLTKRTAVGSRYLTLMVVFGIACFVLFIYYKQQVQSEIFI